LVTFLRFRKEENFMTTPLSGQVKIEVSIYLPQLEVHRRANAEQCLKALPNVSDVAVLAGACGGTFGWVTFVMPKELVFSAGSAAWIAEMREAVDRVLWFA
jgi:hypothetical protein